MKFLSFTLVRLFILFLLVLNLKHNFKLYLSCALNSQIISSCSINPDYTTVSLRSQGTTRANAIMSKCGQSAVEPLTSARIINGLEAKSHSWPVKKLIVLKENNKI